MQKKSLIQTNPHLRTAEEYQYREALVANVSSSTAIETGTPVASIAKAIAPIKTPQRSAR